MTCLSFLSKPVVDLHVVESLSLESLRRRVEEWAGCKGKPTDDWFPNEPQQSCEKARAAYVEKARGLCAGCPVVAECLELTLRIEAEPYVIPHGIFGGLAPWERQKLLRNRRRRVHAARTRGELAEVAQR
jgi:WhiB family redox-sensing transcriptional regulator